MGTNTIEQQVNNLLAEKKIASLKQGYRDTTDFTIAERFVTDKRTPIYDNLNPAGFHRYPTGASYLPITHEDSIGNETTIPFMPSADFYLWSAAKNFTAHDDNETPYTIIGRLYKDLYKAIKPIQTGQATDGVMLVNARSLGVDDGIARAKAIEQSFKSYADAFFTAMNANPDAIINSVANRIISSSNANRDREVAKMQRMSSVANGFFNTNINRRVFEITNGYQIELNKTLGDLTGGLYQTHKQMALGVIQALAGWRSQTVPIDLETTKTASDVMRQYYMTQMDLVGSVENMVSKGWTYAQAQAQRWMFNTQQEWGAKPAQMKWEAEFLQIMANVGGQRGDSGNPFFQAVLGIGEIAAGIAAAALPGGVAAPLGAAAAKAGLDNTAAAVGRWMGAT